VVIVGIDLAGPSNTADTVAVVAETRGDALDVVEVASDLSDAAIVELARRRGSSNGPITFGLDAPLSYNDGGGDRPGDKALRRLVVEAGLRSGSIMTPTMTRMAYLTLRGHAVARALESLGEARIVEVHPGAAMVLRGAPVAAVRGFSTDRKMQTKLLAWLRRQGVRGLEARKFPRSHHVAAVGALLGAWSWARGRSVWCQPAEPPAHPYDFAC
jgi:predicted nuclease with RNAse H fold